MKKSIAMLLATLVLLTACGQKGPLYLPQEAQQSEEKDKDETES